MQINKKATKPNKCASLSLLLLTSALLNIFLHGNFQCFNFFRVYLWAYNAHENLHDWKNMITFNEKFDHKFMIWKIISRT